MPMISKIVLSAAANGPWTSLAAALQSHGAEVQRIEPGAGLAELPDGWIPNALVTTPAPHQTARFDQLDIEAWEASVEAELDTRFLTAQAVARLMLGNGGGSIVHVVSSAGLLGAPNAGSATIAAFASAGLSRGIALDLPAGHIRSNTLAADSTPDSIGAVASLVTFLCGPHAEAITGQIAAIGATELQLLGQSRPLRVAHHDGHWDEAALAAQIERWKPFLHSLPSTEALTP